jgi:hypothetical protein
MYSQQTVVYQARDRQPLGIKRLCNSFNHSNLQEFQYINQQYPDQDDQNV